MKPFQIFNVLGGGAIGVDDDIDAAKAKADQFKAAQPEQDFVVKEIELTERYSTAARVTDGDE